MFEHLSVSPSISRSTIPKKHTRSNQRTYDEGQSKQMIVKNTKRQRDFNFGILLIHFPQISNNNSAFLSYSIDV